MKNISRFTVGLVLISAPFLIDVFLDEDLNITSRREDLD